MELELSHQQIIAAIQSTRSALVSALVDDVPLAAQLLAVAAIDDFAVLMGTAPAAQRGDLFALVNEKLAGVGLELVERPRN
jgi:hypothetical protein